jgi:hypothetical protein
MKTEEYRSLVKKIFDLEKKVEMLEKHTISLDKISQSLMETCIQLTKATTENNKTLDQIVDFVTGASDDVLADVSQDVNTAEKNTSDMTPEELSAYKKQMN